MKSPLYCLNAVFVLVQAVPNPQAANAAVATGSLKGLPSVPASVVPKTPSPFANAALWHEAVTSDATSGGSANTQYLYALLAYLQTQENSSLNIGSDSLSDAGLVSQELQYAQLFPTDFNQAQALDPAKTQSKSTLVKRVR